MTRMRGSWLLVLGALGAAACGDTSGRGRGVPAPEAVQQQARLEPFASCEALEEHIEDSAVLDMRASIEQSKRAYLDSSGGRGVGGTPEFADAVGVPSAAPGAGAGDAPRAPAAPDDYTTTNTQVAGVDEADFVENDGTRILVLSGKTLYLHRSWPPSELARASALSIEGWPREMFLDEQSRVVVFSSISEPLPGDDAGRGGVVAPVMDCASMYCGGWGSSTTKVTVLDVSDLAHPTVTSEVYLPGLYSNARRVGSAVRLVLHDALRYPAGVRWWPEEQPTVRDDRERLARAFDALADRNEELIRAQSLAQWLPEGRRRLADGSTRSLGYECADFQRSSAPARLGLVTLASLDLEAPGADPQRTVVVAEPGVVYASTESLYLASRHWWWWPEAGQTDFTYLHKFDIRDPKRAVYRGSGGVDGYLLNQFSLDEHEGVLRVATTVSRRGEPTQWGGWTAETTNRLWTLAEREGRLALLGQTEELAKGERIFSARFLGTRGFVVTFRQVDPLFTFDLSDPAHPRKVGELKVPGFSTYIHPVGERHLLTIGMQVPESGGWPRSLKLSLFDVSDMAAPREAFTQVVGSASSWSEALYEHKAFNYFPARKLLAIPFADWSGCCFADYWGGFTSDLRVFEVDVDQGFTPRGALSVRDLYQAHSYSSWTWYWTPQVRRSVMADDYVYAISDAGIRVAPLERLDVPLATVPFSPTFY